MKKKVCVVQHAPHEGPGTFGGVLREYGFEIETLFATQAGPQAWEQVSRSSLVLVMGGSMGVYEKDLHSFLRPELAALEKRIREKLPTLGVCLGAQLLAEASGGRAYLSGRREVGWHEVQLTDAGLKDPVLGRLDWSKPVFHWHQDTYDLPGIGVGLANSERFAQQAFRLGENIYGLQFHPEVPQSEVREWVLSEPHLPYGSADGVQSVEEILHGAARHSQAMRELARELLERFLILIS
ncbi:MAG: gamma-glutamyl-gamma-aminobutyrate hydrolase family protein [Bdellovibrionota bacterium]